MGPTRMLGHPRADAEVVALSLKDYRPAVSVPDPMAQEAKPLAHGQNHCQRCWDDQCLARRTRFDRFERLCGQSLLRFVEPRSADPHATWCGGRGQQWPRLPDLCRGVNHWVTIK